MSRTGRSARWTAGYTHGGIGLIPRGACTGTRNGRCPIPPRTRPPCGPPALTHPLRRSPGPAPSCPMQCPRDARHHRRECLCPRLAACHEWRICASRIIGWFGAAGVTGCRGSVVIGAVAPSSFWDPGGVKPRRLITYSTSRCASAARRCWPARRGSGRTDRCCRSVSTRCPQGQAGTDRRTGRPVLGDVFVKQDASLSIAQQLR